MVVWLRNSLIILLIMSETEKALSTQTKEILGETVVLGEGFYDDDDPIEEEKGSWSSYVTEKLVGAKEKIEKFKGYVEDFKTKLVGEPELETMYVPELKVTPLKENPVFSTVDAETKVDTPKKEEPVIDYDANWYQSDNTINILKNESYSNLYATGEVGQQMGYQLPLGYRTNNWLSQHQLGINWDGLSKTKEDKKTLPNFKKETHSVMEVFETPEFGVRAGMVDVMTKALKPASEYNKDTITFKEGKDGSPIITLQKLIDSGYMENADNYIRVGKGLGIDLNTEFNLFNKEEAMKWFDYMLLSEMGTFKNDIPKAERDKVFNSAYDMAMDRMRDETYTYNSTAKKYLDSSQ